MSNSNFAQNSVDEFVTLLVEWKATIATGNEAAELLKETPDDEEMIALQSEIQANLSDYVNSINRLEETLILSKSKSSSVTTSTEQGQGSLFSRMAAFTASGGVSNSSTHHVPHSKYDSTASPLHLCITKGAEMSKVETSPGHIQTVCLYPKLAPLQINYDNQGRWYSCILIEILKPIASYSSSFPFDGDVSPSRYRYRVWILGYNIEETVHCESLRTWDILTTESSSTASSSEVSDCCGSTQISPGSKCYAIDNKLGVFRGGIIERMTPTGNVVVKLLAEKLDNVQNNNNNEKVQESPTAGNTVVVVDQRQGQHLRYLEQIQEVPPSHIIISVAGGNRFFRNLVKKVVLSDEEKVLIKKQRIGMKRARAEEKLQRKEEQCARNVENFRNDLMDFI
eukprot:Tbor_TRINITY_DN5424_c4_g3::TRINITY_DN5424_c4_g3_i2::g.24540::m.24540